jgi:hypothetical protein
MVPKLTSQNDVGIVSFTKEMLNAVECGFWHIYSVA